MHSRLRHRPLRLSRRRRAHPYRSIRKLLALPDETRVFLCHDYLPEGRDRFCWQTTIGEQRLILPSVQVNMRAGHLPPPEDNGVQYMKIPLNRL